MAAVVVDEPVLQGERIEPAARLNVPRDLLGLRGQPALGDMLLDDDDMLVLPERGDNSFAIERL